MNAVADGKRKMKMRKHKVLNCQKIYKKILNYRKLKKFKKMLDFIIDFLYTSSCVKEMTKDKKPDTKGYRGVAQLG